MVKLFKGINLDYAMTNTIENIHSCSKCGFNAPKTGWGLKPDGAVYKLCLRCREMFRARNSISS